MLTFLQAINQLGSVTTVAELRALAEQTSATATGPGGILYSGRIAGIGTENFAVDLAAKYNLNVINGTQRALFLESKAFATKLATLIPDATQRSAALYNPTSGFWGQASKEFAASLTGDIYVVANNADPTRVLALTELPTILADKHVTSINGIPLSSINPATAVSQVSAATEQAIASGKAFYAVGGWLEFSSDATSFYGLPQDASTVSGSVLAEGGGVAITPANATPAKSQPGALTNTYKPEFTPVDDGLPAAKTTEVTLTGAAGTALKALKIGTLLWDVGDTALKADDQYGAGDPEKAAQIIADFAARAAVSARVVGATAEMGPIVSLALGTIAGLGGQQAVNGIWNLVDNVGRLLAVAGSETGTVPAAAQPYATSLTQAGMPVTTANALAASVYGRYLTDTNGGKAEAFSTYLANQKTAASQDEATQQAAPGSSDQVAVVQTQENGQSTAVVTDSSGNPQYRTTIDPTAVDALNPSAGPSDTHIVLKGTIIENATPEPAADTYTVDANGTLIGLSDGGGPYGYELPDGGTFTNEAGWTLSGRQYGLWAPSGATTVVNDGTIIGSTAAGISIGASGSVTNTGSIGGANGVSVGGAGHVTNTGAIQATNGNAVTIDGGGTVSNAAGRSIDGTAGGVIIAGAPGTLTNSGTIIASAASGIGAELGVGGSVSNATPTALIKGGEYGVWAPSGTTTVVNKGTIIGTSAVGVAIGGSGTVTNNLLIKGASGVRIGGAGTVSNSGTIQATNGNAVTIDGGGTVSNAAGHSIVGTAGGVIIAGAPGTLTNSGTIIASAASGIGAELGVGGSVSNATSTTLIKGGEYGVWAPSGTTTVVNKGTIIGTSAVGVAIGGSGTVTNNLLIKGANAVRIGGAGTVSNSGTIQATNGNAVTIDGGGTVSNAAGHSIVGTAGGVIIAGAPGKLTNSGTIIASAASGIGAELGVGGSVSNATSTTLIKGGEYGIWAPSGTTTVGNTGTVIGGSAVGVAIGGSGTVTNNLLIKGANAVRIGGAGTVSNSGTIQATNGNAVTIDGGGTVSNAAGHSIVGTAGGVIIAGAPGKLTNSGTIIASAASGIGAELGVGGSVSNATSTTLIKGGEYGIWAPSGTTTVGNTGTVIGGSAVGVAIGGSGTVTNNLLIEGANGVRIGGAGTVSNSGAIQATNGNAVTIDGGGTVSNAAGHSIVGTAGGVIIAGAPGKLTNSGTIIASAASGIGAELGVGGSVSNATSTTLIKGGEYGIWAPSGTTTVGNTGTVIGGSAVGVAIGGSGTVTNNLLIEGANGVRIGGAGTVSNSGTIQATNGNAVTIDGGGTVSNAAGHSIDGTAGGVIIAGAPGTLTNDGSIIASAASGIGAELGVGGSVSNATSTLIKGGEYGVWVPSGAASITNDGTIQGGIGVAFGGIGSTLTNAGTIIGTGGVAIVLGSGNKLVIDPGSTIIGKVMDPGASDTLDLAAGTPGSITNLDQNFVGFGTVVVDGDASWTMHGVSNIATLSNHGTVSVAAGARVNVRTLIASGNDVIRLDGGSTLDIASVLGSGSRIQFLADDRLNLVSPKGFGIQSGSMRYAGPLVQNFGAGDSIDLRNFSTAGMHLEYVAVTGLLDVDNSSGHVAASLRFDTSSLGPGLFHSGSDGHGGALITIG